MTPGRNIRRLMLQEYRGAVSVPETKSTQRRKA
jgi:hypothetical protein